MDEKHLNRFKLPHFPDPQSVGERPWGREDLLLLVSGKFMLKRLFVRAGCKGGVQFHRLKDEGGVLISGEMIIRHDDGSGNLIERHIKPGDVFHFPPGVVHQEEAITDCVIIEASTPHFNDRVRAESFYGIEANGGLPSTALDEVEEK